MVVLFFSCLIFYHRSKIEFLGLRQRHVEKQMQRKNLKSTTEYEDLRQSQITNNRMVRDSTLKIARQSTFKKSVTTSLHSELVPTENLHSFSPTNNLSSTEHGIDLQMLPWYTRLFCFCQCGSVLCCYKKTAEYDAIRVDISQTDDNLTFIRTQ